MRRERIVELSVATSLSLVSGVLAFLCVPFDLPRDPAPNADRSSARLGTSPTTTSDAMTTALVIDSAEPDTRPPETRRARRGANARTDQARRRSRRAPTTLDDVEALLVPPNGIVLDNPWIALAEPILPPQVCDDDANARVTGDTDALFEAMRAPAERELDGAADVLFLLGVARHSVLDLASAADYYEAFAEHDPSRDAEACSEVEQERGTCVDAPVALERAVELRRALGQEERAIALGKEYVETYGETRVEDAARMSDVVGGLLERRGPAAAEAHFAEHTRRFARHVPAPMALRHWVDRGRSEWQAGHRDRAARSFRRALRVWRRGASDVAALSPDIDGSEFDSTLEAAAEAGYHLARLRQARFDAIALPAYRGNGARAHVERWVNGVLRPAVLHKVRALRDAERAYRTVAELGATRHRVAALARTGEMYRELAAAFAAAPLPEVRETTELEVAVSPEDWRTRPRERLERRAIEAFESCLSQAIATRFYVDDARACGAALTELAPERHPGLPELAPRRLRVSEDALAPAPPHAGDRPSSGAPAACAG